MTRLFTAAGRRYIGYLLRALADHADRLDRRFRARLRQDGWGTLEVQAFLALTPAACARLGSLPSFFEQVEYNGRRLANLNVTPADALETLRQFGRLMDPLLDGRFEPAREQLHLATRLALDHAFYQVREAESQACFDLSRAEVEAEDWDDLRRRLVGVLVRALGAAGGRLSWLERGTEGKLARPRCIERGPDAERLIVDPALRGGFRSYWSYPFGGTAILQLGFPGLCVWLPRQRALLAFAATRFHKAWERARLQEQVRRLEAESRRAEEEERRRIGRELHDEAGQSMMLLRLQLEILERAAPIALRPQLAAARELAGRTAVELRRIIAALSPAVLERLGLEAAIRHLALRFHKLYRAKMTARIPGLRAPVPRPIEEVVYRVAQECLHNIARHSRATHVNLCLSAADKRIRLSVADNGAGFRADQVAGKPKSFGLAGMRERAALLGGTLAIRSRPGAGTRVTLELPLTAAPVVSHGKDSHSLS